jgi:hypothetical protein
VQCGDERQRDAGAGERVGEVEVAGLVGDHQPAVRRADRRQAAELREGGPEGGPGGGAVERRAEGFSRVEKAGRLPRGRQARRRKAA